MIHLMSSRSQSLVSSLIKYNTFGFFVHCSVQKVDNTGYTVGLAYIVTSYYVMRWSEKTCDRLNPPVTGYFL